VGEDDDDEGEADFYAPLGESHKKIDKEELIGAGKKNK
jgi:hypothetical protein